MPNCAMKPKKERRYYVGDQTSQIVEHAAVHCSRPIEKVCCFVLLDTSANLHSMLHSIPHMSASLMVPLTGLRDELGVGNADLATRVPQTELGCASAHCFVTLTSFLSQVDFTVTSSGVGPTLLVTEPLFNPASIQKEMDEVVFEAFGFCSYFRSPVCPSCHVFLSSPWTMCRRRHTSYEGIPIQIRRQEKIHSARPILLWMLGSPLRIQSPSSI